MRGCSSSSSTASMRWFRNGKLNSARPRVSREMRTNAAGIVSPAALRLRRERVRRVRRVVDAVGGEHEHAVPVERRQSALRRRGAARRGASSSSSTARRCVEVERLQRRPRRDAVEERAVLHAEEQADAARRRLRPELAAGRGFLVDEVEDDLVQLGSGVALREPERDGPAGAPVDLGHPVDLGRGALVGVAGPLEARRDLVHALALPAEHVGDREQLVLARPGARHEAAVGDAVQQRARRREAERAGGHRLVDEVGDRRDVVLGRGRCRRGRARPSRSGAARSARPCRRR